MRDSLGRDITYLRISITDRCNLRCKYCMPDGIQPVGHCDILRYEEILRICRIAVSLGIRRFKVTGGEPLVRKGCTAFIGALKLVPGVEQVTITTNGLLLPEHLEALHTAGIDGITVSLDSLNPNTYGKITGHDGAVVSELLQTLRDCRALGIPTKINAVLLEETRADILPLADLARENAIDVRYIEQMPIGGGRNGQFTASGEVLSLLRQAYPDLRELPEHHGNGPARYYSSSALTGKIGIIDAVSHKFCDSCNRIRLTGTGWLKPCLCYESGADLRSLLRSGCTDEEIRQEMHRQILQKPQGHCFESSDAVTEHRTMSQIGG